MSDVMNLCRNNMHVELDALFQARNWLAFFDIDYGGLSGGVFTAACPPEALHSLENGLINHCLKELFANVIPPTACKHFDSVVQKWTFLSKQRHMKNYAADFPRLLFPDGVSSITDVSAATKIGIIFAIIVASLTTDGKSVLLNKADMTSEKYANMVEAFEMMICYWAWLKKDNYWECNDMDALAHAQTAIKKTVYQLVHLFPRKTGCEWKIPKIHEQLHIAHNIHLFGAHQNIHTGPQEHNHIENTKNLVKRTQQCKAIFDNQIANRLVDKYIIDHTWNKILYHQSKCKNECRTNLECKNDTIHESTQLASKFEVYIQRDQISNQIQVKSQWITDSLKHKKLSQSLLNLIVDQIFMPEDIETQYTGIHIKGFTEYQQESFTFWCHPNYRNEGPWFDYVFIAWDQGEKESDGSDDDSMDEKIIKEEITDLHSNPKNLSLVPAQLICFIINHKNEMSTIIHSCLNEKEKLSVITYKWELEYEKQPKLNSQKNKKIIEDDTSNWTPVYHNVSVDTIQKHCLMIPLHLKSKYMIQIVDQDKWADAFSIN